MKNEERREGMVIDVGANVGMATFAAAVMGFKVLAFEPVFENLQRICDGIWFNRVGDLVTVFEAAASDRNGNITFHKVYVMLNLMCLGFGFLMNVHNYASHGRVSIFFSAYACIRTVL